MNKAAKTWTKTRIENVYRRASGVYYARVTIGGKRTWRSLETENLAVAQAEARKLQDDTMKWKEAGVDAGFARTMTGEELVRLHMDTVNSDPSIKESTRHYWRQVIVSLRNTWPEFFASEIRKITAQDAQAWVGRNKDEMSPTRFNNALGLLKNLFALAVEHGARRTNPVESIKRRRVNNKNLSETLPGNAEFNALVTAVREGGGRFSKACAELVELLAYTGMRTGEARWLRWSHCHFDRGEMVVVGDPHGGTKNSEFRHVPMIPPARELLERMQRDHPPKQKTDKVLLVFEAQKAMDRAFTELGVSRFTHHDLRHLFATRCIESGVDIPTVAKWLGHKDGGALAMKTYGHLRREHSLAAASKVSFAA